MPQESDWKARAMAAESALAPARELLELWCAAARLDGDDNGSLYEDSVAACALSTTPTPAPAASPCAECEQLRKRVAELELMYKASSKARDAMAKMHGDGQRWARWERGRADAAEAELDTERAAHERTLAELERAQEQLLLLRESNAEMRSERVRYIDHQCDGLKAKAALAAKKAASAEERENR